MKGHHASLRGQATWPATAAWPLLLPLLLLACLHATPAIAIPIAFSVKPTNAGFEDAALAAPGEETGAVPGWETTGEAVSLRPDMTAYNPLASPSQGQHVLALRNGGIAGQVRQGPCGRCKLAPGLPPLAGMLSRGWPRFTGWISPDLAIAGRFGSADLTTTIYFINPGLVCSRWVAAS